EPMAKYSPEFRQRFGRGPITVRHVLTHTSHDPSGDTYWYDGYRFSFLSDVVARASGHPFRELLVKNILDAIGMADSAPGHDGRKLPYGLGWFVQSHEGARLVWHYGYWPESFSSLYLKLPERKLALLLLANSDGLSAPFSLGGGDVTRSAFAGSFLRIFVREE